MTRRITTKAEIKKTILKHYLALRKLNDFSVTAFVDTDYDNVEKRIWSIVMCLDREFPNSILVKIAYRSANSIMTEYDMDFIMPINEETMDVDDTEVSISGDLLEIDRDIDYILKEYDRIVDTYLNNEYGYYAA